MGPFDSHRFLNCLLFLPLMGCSFVSLFCSCFPSFSFTFSSLLLGCCFWSVWAFCYLLLLFVLFFCFSFSVHVTCHLIFVEDRGE